MVMICAFCAAFVMFSRSCLIFWYSFGWGGSLYRHDAKDTPASRSIFVSGVSIWVHMDRAPRLSAAIGVILMFFSVCFCICLFLMWNRCGCLKLFFSRGDF